MQPSVHEVELRQKLYQQFFSIIFAVTKKQQYFFLSRTQNLVSNHPGSRCCGIKSMLDFATSLLRLSLTCISDILKVAGVLNLLNGPINDNIVKCLRF